MKRRKQAPTLPLFNRSDPPPDPPPAADLTAEAQALARELGKRLVIGKASSSPRAPAPITGTTRPAPIASKPRRYEHLETPIETLRRMAASGDRAAQIELNAIREAVALEQAAAGNNARPPQEREPSVESKAGTPDPEPS